MNPVSNRSRNPHSRISLSLQNLDNPGTRSIAVTRSIMDGSSWRIRHSINYVVGTGGLKQTWGSETAGVVGRPFSRIAHPLHTFWLLTCELPVRCLRHRNSGRGHHHPILPVMLGLI